MDQDSRWRTYPADAKDRDQYVQEISTHKESVATPWGELDWWRERPELVDVFAPLMFTRHPGVREQLAALMVCYTPATLLTWAPAAAPMVVALELGVARCKPVCLDPMALMLPLPPPPAGLQRRVGKSASSAQSSGQTPTPTSGPIQAQLTALKNERSRIDHQVAQLEVNEVYERALTLFGPAYPPTAATPVAVPVPAEPEPAPAMPVTRVERRPTPEQPAFMKAILARWPSLKSFAAHLNRPRQNITNLRRAWYPALQAEVAAALGVEPPTLWPERYDRAGLPVEPAEKRYSQASLLAAAALRAQAIERPSVQDLMARAGYKTYVTLAQAAGLDRYSISSVVRGLRWSHSIQAAIAAALGSDPVSLWPERYDTQGKMLERRGGLRSKKNPSSEVK